MGPPTWVMTLMVIAAIIAFIMSIYNFTLIRKAFKASKAREELILAETEETVTTWFVRYWKDTEDRQVDIFNDEAEYVEFCKLKSDLGFMLEKFKSTSDIFTTLEEVK